jgi:hypothetical protein
MKYKISVNTGENRIENFWVEANSVQEAWTKGIRVSKCPIIINVSAVVDCKPWKDLTVAQIEEMRKHGNLDGINDGPNHSWVDDDGNTITLADINAELRDVYEELYK